MKAKTIVNFKKVINQLIILKLKILYMFVIYLCSSKNVRKTQSHTETNEPTLYEICKRIKINEQLPWNKIMREAFCYCSLSMSLIFDDSTSCQCLSQFSATDMPPVPVNSLCLSAFSIKLLILELRQRVIPSKCNEHAFSWRQYNTP